MGGQVRVVLKKDSKVTSFVAFTNSITRILKSNEFIQGDLSEIYESIEYFEKMKADYAKNKESRNFEDRNAPFYGIYDNDINPVQYGIILIDVDNKRISSCQQYSNLETMHSVFGLYQNGLLIILNTEFDTRMKNKSFSHFEIYDEKSEEFKKIKINENSCTLIDLINEIKENIDLENLDYTEILGIAANVHFSVYLNTPYEIKSFKEMKKMINEFEQAKITLSEKEIETFNKFGENNE